MLFKLKIKGSEHLFNKHYILVKEFLGITVGVYNFNDKKFYSPVYSSSRVSNLSDMKKLIEQDVKAGVICI